MNLTVMTSKKPWFDPLTIIFLPLKLLKIAVFIIISPFVVTFDLFRWNETLDKSWAVYLLIFSLIPMLISWSILDHNIQIINKVFGTISAYSQFSNKKTDVKNVEYQELINFYSLKNDLDPALVAAVIERESGFNPEAVSTAGAKGLMQITPATWRYLVPESKCDGNHMPPAKGEDCIFNPEANIRAGTNYLKQLLDHYNGNTVTVLAAYNAGQGNVKKYGRPEKAFVPVFPETQNYVRDVLSIWFDTREKLPDLNLEEPLFLLNLQKTLFLISGSMWFVLALWIFFKSDKNRIHTYKYSA